jgi:hypothetical protein
MVTLDCNVRGARPLVNENTPSAGPRAGDAFRHPVVSSHDVLAT